MGLALQLYSAMIYRPSRIVVVFIIAGLLAADQQVAVAFDNSSPALSGDISALCGSETLSARAISGRRNTFFARLITFVGLGALGVAPLPLTILRGGNKSGAVISDVEPVALADPQTRLPIRQSVGRQEVHERGWWHQTVHVYVVDSRGRFVMQRRSRSLRVSPGKLQVSISGHVDFKDIENVADFTDPAWVYAAAQREGLEEFGISLDASKLVLVNNTINGIRRDAPNNREFTSVLFYRSAMKNWKRRV